LKLTILSIAILLILALSSCCLLKEANDPTLEDNDYGYLNLKFKLPSSLTQDRLIPSNSEKIRIAIFNPDINGQSFKYVEDIDLSDQSGTVEKSIKLKAKDNYLIGVAALKDIDPSFESSYCENAALVLTLNFATFTIEPAKNSTVQLTLQTPEATLHTTEIPTASSQRYSATLTVKNIDFELLNSFSFDALKALYYYSTDPLSQNIYMHTSLYDFSKTIHSTQIATFSNLNLYTPSYNYNGFLYCQFGFELGELFDNPNASSMENAWLLFPEINSTSTGYLLSDYGSVTVVIE